MRPSPASINAALRRLACDAGGFEAARYFRGDHRLRFYNVGSAQVRALARSICLEMRGVWTIREAMALADRLLPDPHLETKGVGVELVARYRREFSPAWLPRWKRWLASGQAGNWATTDAICGLLIGPLLLDYPELRPVVAAWSRHRSLWVRRASAVALIPSVRRGAALPLAYEVAETLEPDGEDLIHKAVGWMLRDAGKADAARLERYLLARGPRMPRTTVRYAIERFPASKRAELLAATRLARGRRGPV